MAHFERISLTMSHRWSFWSSPPAQALQQLETVSHGLSSDEAHRTDTAIILVSGLPGFWQERSANHAVACLLAIVQSKADVWRAGSLVAVPVEEVVSGDSFAMSRRRHTEGGRR
jgi:magnesium-transporting ATPase (P-type)